MSKSDSTARRVQRETGWKYTAALKFVRDAAHRKEAVDYARSQKVTLKEAFVELAKAYAEVEEETDDHSRLQD